MADNYLDPKASLPYCRGCGHAQVVRHLSRALEKLALPPRSVVLATDIGCVGLADSLFPFLHTVHTTHGRSTAFATGMALAEAVGESPGLSDERQAGLKPIVLIGDGGAMIGLLHLVHAAQLNVDITVLVHNNFLFGMTGGQHSALTPVGFVTSTTTAGNPTPPLDLLALLRAAHAGFLARQYATDPELDSVIADAIAYPGFALVEVLELCTAFGTRWNDLTGKKLKQLAEQQGYVIGRLLTGDGRPDFRESYEKQFKPSGSAEMEGEAGQVVARSPLTEELRIVVAGSASERVQSAAALLCRAALAAGLYSTQKKDNPVTQGTGFSLAEICLSGRPILYTGMEHPDVVVISSHDGLKELQRNGLLARCSPETLIVLDSELEPAPVTGRLLRLPLRQTASATGAALVGLVAGLESLSVFPAKAWEAALAAQPEKRRQGLARALQGGAELARGVTATETISPKEAR